MVIVCIPFLLWMFSAVSVSSCNFLSVKMTSLLKQCVWEKFISDWGTLRQRFMPCLQKILGMKPWAELDALNGTCILRMDRLCLKIKSGSGQPATKCDNKFTKTDGKQWCHCWHNRNLSWICWSHPFGHDTHCSKICSLTLDWRSKTSDCLLYTYVYYLYVLRRSWEVII